MLFLSLPPATPISIASLSFFSLLTLFPLPELNLGLRNHSSRLLLLQPVSPISPHFVDPGSHRPPHQQCPRQRLAELFREVHLSFFFTFWYGSPRYVL